MPNPFSFPATTSNFDLPLLFSGQAQKEFFLNQSIASFDALLTKSVEAMLNDPPVNPTDGQCYLIGSAPTGEWVGFAEWIAIRLSAAWHYVEPQDGFELFDRATKQKLFYKSEWYRPISPSQPMDGAVVDAEARASLAGLITELQKMGMLPATS